MIHSYVIISIAVLLSVMILVMIGQKLRVAYPIFLVIAGLLISFVPGIPTIEIEPDLVFLIFYLLFYLKPPGLLPGRTFINGENRFFLWPLD